jgi:hypothetical protein
MFVKANALTAGTETQSGVSNAVLLMAEGELFQLVVCWQVLDEAERHLRKKLPQASLNFVVQRRVLCRTKPS